MTAPASAPPTPWDPRLLELYRSRYVPATVRMIVSDEDGSPLMLEEGLVTGAPDGSSSGVDTATT